MAWAQRKCDSRALSRRKCFYLLSCEYCFSHYVAARIPLLTQFTLCSPTGGATSSLVRLVWVANHLMSVFGAACVWVSGASVWRSDSRKPSTSAPACRRWKTVPPRKGGRPGNRHLTFPIPIPIAFFNSKIRNP